MNITLSEVVVVAAGILTIMNVVDRILSWARQAKAPEEDRLKAAEFKILQLEQQIGEHDRMFEVHMGYFANDKVRINVLEKGSKVTSKALLALLGHANTGNNSEEMREAEADLRRYLIER